MKLDEETQRVLSELTVSYPGLVRMPQIDRKLYLKVDKALEAMGGTWDRKQRAHVFADLPDGGEVEGVQQRIDQALALGEVITGADLGFFRTPDPLARRLVAMAEIQADHSVLEPSAGDGALYRAIIEPSIDYPQHEPPTFVGLVERDEGRRKKLMLWARSCDEICSHDDFLDFEESEPYDRAVMNPPFCKVGRGNHIDHVRHAFSMLAPGGILVSVLPAGVLFRTDKQHMRFRADFITKHGGEITELPDGSFAESGTNVRTCVLKVRR